VTPLVVFVLGLLVVGTVAVAVAAPLLRARRAPAPRDTTRDPERYRLERERDLAYAAIKEAEFDHAMGKLSPEDYAALRARYEAEALRALTVLERRSPSAGGTRDAAGGGPAR